MSRCHTYSINPAAHGTKRPVPLSLHHRFALYPRESADTHFSQKAHTQPARKTPKCVTFCNILSHFHRNAENASNVTHFKPNYPFRSPALLLLLTTILLSGCVRYNELIVLNADRSGSATLILERPADPRADAAAAMFHEDQMRQGLPAGVQFDWKTSAVDSSAIISATYTFDDYRTLIAWAANKSSPLNNISILEKNGTLEFSRRIAPIGDATAAELKEFGSDISITFNVQGPGPLLESNAPRADGRTATWEFNATDLFAPAGRTLTARFSTERGRSAYTFVALALLALLSMIALWFLTRRLRGK